jgi:hypothetical protein
VRSAAIAAMTFADRLASCAIHDSFAPPIVPRCGLCCERLTSCFDRTEAVLASCFGHARIAMPASALNHHHALTRSWRSVASQLRSPAPIARRIAGMAFCGLSCAEPRGAAALGCLVLAAPSPIPRRSVAGRSWTPKIVRPPPSRQGSRRLSRCDPRLQRVKRRDLNCEAAAS